MRYSILGASKAQIAQKQFMAQKYFVCKSILTFYLRYLQFSHPFPSLKARNS